jgi:hypothetical protein
MKRKKIERVSRRDFQQYTSKYLKELPIIVTRRGVDDFKVEEVLEPVAFDENGDRILGS